MKSDTMGDIVTGIAWLLLWFFACVGAVATILVVGDGKLICNNCDHGSYIVDVKFEWTK